MAAIVPSYLAKVHRAERHLDELQAELDRYAASMPYTVAEVKSRKGKRVSRRLKFTSLPENTDIPIIAADAVYDLRSGLDHLMAALVAKKHRDSVMFPVFFRGVWEPERPEDNAQHVKWRKRWASDIRTVHPEPALVPTNRRQPRTPVPVESSYPARTPVIHAAPSSPPPPSTRTFGGLASKGAIQAPTAPQSRSPADSAGGGAPLEPAPPMRLLPTRRQTAAS